MKSTAKLCVWPVLGLSLLFSFPGSAAPLSDELRLLLGTNPEIKAAEKGAQSAGQEIDKARAGYLPQVLFEADVGPERINSPAVRSRGGAPSRETSSTATLTVTQNLFDGFSTSADMRIARLNNEIAQYSLEGTRQNVLFQGIVAYLDVLRQGRLIELAFANEENIQIQLNLEDERVQRGAGIAVDVLQAKSRLQIAKERRVSFEGALQDAIARYVQVFGRAPDLEDMTDPPPPVDVIPSELESSIDVALSENPAVRNSAVSVEVARETRRRVRSEYYPDFDLVGRWNYEKDKDAVIGDRREYALLLQMSWDLFNGFSTRATEVQAAFDYGASKDNQMLVGRRVIEQTKLAWQGLFTARERVELLENAVNIAAEVFDARRKLREAGKETVINVLDAESEIFATRINFVTASYDELIGIYQLLLAMGQLTDQQLDLHGG